MSAAPALTCVLPSALAVATPAHGLRSRPIEGMAFYRRHCLGLLRRYLRASMEMGRAPCVLGNVVFRGRVSSYKISSFEDVLIFILDVERCLKRLDAVSQAVIAHVALEDYTMPEAAAMMGESERSVARIYGEALDKLTRLFLDFGLFLQTLAIRHIQAKSGMRNMQTKSCVKRTRALVRAGWTALGVLTLAAMLPIAAAQMSVTTVQGTIYRADGSAASGTALISWPAFSTAQNQAVAAGSLSATIGANGSRQQRLAVLRVSGCELSQL